MSHLHRKDSIDSRLATQIEAERNETNISKEGIPIEAKLKKYYDHWRISVDGMHEPAAKMLIASIRWLHGIQSFGHLKATEQAFLLHCNWKELFVFTAAQYSFYFEEGKRNCNRQTSI